MAAALGMCGVASPRALRVGFRRQRGLHPPSPIGPKRGRAHRDAAAQSSEAFSHDSVEVLASLRSAHLV